MSSAKSAPPLPPIAECAAHDEFCKPTATLNPPDIAAAATDASRCSPPRDSSTLSTLCLRYVIAPDLRSVLKYSPPQPQGIKPSYTIGDQTNACVVPTANVFDLVRDLIHHDKITNITPSNIASRLYRTQVPSGWTVNSTHDQSTTMYNNNGSANSTSPAITLLALEALPTFDFENDVVVIFPDSPLAEPPKPVDSPSKSTQTSGPESGQAQKRLLQEAESTKPVVSAKKPRTKAEKAEHFLKKIQGKAIPDDAMEIINENIEIVKSSENDTSDSINASKLLNHLTSLPWGNVSPETASISAVRRHLDANHCGLKPAKELILQFLATNKLAKKPSGRVLCLTGSPGVGKTSLAESVALALNRKFVRISLPAVSNTPDLVGHTRAWRGAEPGAISKAMMRVETANPVILLDEIDKLSTGTSNGNISGNLLSILDPEQNHEFFDFYIGAYLDLSKVMFICTANSVTKIEPTLLDRMEVLELQDYTTEEKVNIGLKYLLPKELDKFGITLGQENSNPSPTCCAQPVVWLSIDTMISIVNLYCTDGGVRDLKRAVEKIGRKLAYEIVVEQDKRQDQSGQNGACEGMAMVFAITEDDLVEYLGTPLNTCTVCRSENSNYAAAVCRHEMCLSCWKKTLVQTGEVGPCPFCRKIVKLQDLRKKN
ncbi:ATP-dependent Lon protease pim1 [Entophlyctis luteolus]|nr:ATP-dependent Lon protease pim1 [Entophlyctis luteolus]